MGSHLKMINFDDRFHELTVEPLIVNDVFDAIESEREELDKLLFTTYHDTDLMETMPKCGCGYLFGQHLILENGRGIVCPKCNKEVQAALDKPLEPLIWVRAPEGVRSLMNPQAWRFLNEFYSLNGNSTQRFSFMKYLTNTDYRPNKILHGRWMDMIDDMGIKRGFNHFYDNFDEIIDKISTFPQFTATRDKREKLRDIRTFTEMYRDCIFPQHLPIHNKSIMVIEYTKFGAYMDTTLKTLIDAVRNFTGIDSEIKNYSIQQKENRSSKLVENIDEFGQEYERTFIAGKPGLARKHVYASRCFYSFRAVINSLTEPHQHDELHLPWALSITVFYIELCGFLIRRHGFSYNEAADFLNYHTHVYHPLIEDIFKQMIDDSPYKGIACILGRNPSMYRTSIQRFFITKIKTDPKIYSISYPIQSVVGPNANCVSKMRRLLH